MASFIGTNKKFRRYIAPRLRNLVQQITKSHKAEVADCEHCGSKKILESAHVHGRDRNEIIDLILNEYTHNEIATVDISIFEERFKGEHHPLEKSILILCHNCHRKYDSKAVDSNPKQQETNASNKPRPHVNNKDCLPITLDPSDPDTFKHELLISKKAEIKTIYIDGRVDKKTWNAYKFKATSSVFGNLRSRPEYRSSSWQTSGIVKVHVKVEKMPTIQTKRDAPSPHLSRYGKHMESETVNYE